MRLWISQIDVIAQCTRLIDKTRQDKIAQEQQSESGGGVTGTQHAPVESQIETVLSVGAQLAPSRHTDSDAWQAERPLRGLPCRTAGTV